MTNVWELFLIINLAMNGAILWRIYSLDIVHIQMYDLEVPPPEEDKDGQ